MISAPTSIYRPRSSFNSPSFNSPKLLSSKVDQTASPSCSLSLSLSFTLPLRMGFFRKIAGLLGFVKDDVYESKGESDDDDDGQAPSRVRFKETGIPRKGFGVKVEIPVDRPHLGPVIIPSSSGDGGVQGLRWYAERLNIDEDGDVADEFLDEVPPETSAPQVNHHKSVARFKVNNGTRPAKVKRQTLLDGKLRQLVEHQGRLQWV